MRAGDREAFAKVLLGFAEVHGKSLSLSAIDLYWTALQDWGIEEFQQAAQHLARSCQFMPKPADFEDLRKSGKPTAAEAWARAVSHASSSSYRRGPLGDPVIDLCVRALGGYVAIAMCDEDKLHFLERRFAEHYEAKQDADVVREALPQLTDSRGLRRLLPHG